jgi:hypothetical protein
MGDVITVPHKIETLNKDKNGSWHNSINNYRNTFSIFCKYNLNDRAY